jgi:hypothetical protein
VTRTRIKGLDERRVDRGWESKGIRNGIRQAQDLHHRRNLSHSPSPSPSPDCLPEV